MCLATNSKNFATTKSNTAEKVLGTFSGCIALKASGKPLAFLLSIRPAFKYPKSMKKTDSLLQDIWPQERDVFVRPDRLKYVRKIIQPKGCVFCQALKAKKRGDVGLLYKSAGAMVVLNKYPYNNGHLLLLPARHVGAIEDLKPQEWNEIHLVLKESISILKKAYSCAGLNVGLNLGAAAGAGIPDHLHYHIIPRWAGDTNFFPLIAETKVVVESLATTFQKLEKKFKSLEGKLK